MTENLSENIEKIPLPVTVEIRRLMHDLSNALEIVLQAGYLLSTADLEDPAREWLGLLEGGAQQAMDLHRELREYVRAHS
jgi:hypothetical protein